ncbi:MAG TPA: TadE family protein [Hyphomicrobiales bacterium]|nr:TadE family protein [Hyphomicrobiales bacterium]
MPSRQQHGTTKTRQAGATAIEFAIMFPLFLTVFYGIVCYAVILLDKQALSTMASEAARAAIAATDENGVRTQIANVIDAHAWIADRISNCDDSGDYYTRVDDRLQICLQATPVPMPTINLGIISLPPSQEELKAMLRSSASVLWQPST